MITTDIRTARCFTCDWTFDGSPIEAKNAGIEHRSATAHHFILSDAAEPDGREALDRMDNGEAQAPAAPPKDGRCKIEGCTNRALAKLGPYAKLCEHHKAEKQATGDVGKRPKVAKPPESKEATVDELTEEVRRTRLAATAAYEAWESAVARLREEFA